VVDYTSSQPDLRKIMAVIEFPIPKTNVRAFLRLIGYCRRFIVGYEKIVEPLFPLTKNECKFN
jgi:hypothetical protein